jgi:hypothetical protein
MATTIEIQPNIITPAIKEQPYFQNHLSYLARSDAHHDLKDVFSNNEYSSNTKLRDAFDGALPVGASQFYNEDAALKSVFVNDPRSLKDILESIQNVTSAKTSETIVDIGSNSTILHSAVIEVKLSDGALKPNWDLITWLIEQGIDYNYKDKFGRKVKDILCSVDTGYGKVLDKIIENHLKGTKSPIKMEGIFYATEDLPSQTSEPPKKKLK